MNRHRKNHSEAGHPIISSSSCDPGAFQTLTFYNGAADTEIKEKPSIFESCQDLLDDDASDNRLTDETPIKEELSVFNQNSSCSIRLANETPCFNKPSMRLVGSMLGMKNNGISSFEEDGLEASVDTATTSFRQLMK